MNSMYFINKKLENIKVSALIISVKPGTSKKPWVSADSGDYVLRTCSDNIDLSALTKHGDVVATDPSSVMKKTSWYKQLVVFVDDQKTHLGEVLDIALSKVVVEETDNNKTILLPLYRTGAATVDRRPEMYQMMYTAALDYLGKYAHNVYFCTYGEPHFQAFLESRGVTEKK